MRDWGASAILYVALDLLESFLRDTHREDFELVSVERAPFS